jgi:hypothetical protein
MTRFCASLPERALGAAAALAAISLSPGSAQAFVVTVGGAQDDVSTFTGSYEDNTSKFQTASQGGVMPWWGQQLLAQDFASAVGANLGMQNAYNTTMGPWFAWDISRLGRGVEAHAFCTESLQWCDMRSGVTGLFAVPSVVLGPRSVDSKSNIYAQVSLYTPPISATGPLPLFGAAAAFGFSRKLRERIKLAPGALVSGLPLA